MQIFRVDDHDDPRLNDYRDIPDAELAVRRGLFVAEGRLLTERLLTSGFDTRSVMVTDAALLALHDTFERPAQIPVYVVPQATMNAVVGFTLHRGCIAIGTRPPSSSVTDVAADAHRLVVLERIANADNVGAIFRNAAAFGADAVILDPASVDPLYRKALRTSMGAALQVPFAHTPDLAAALSDLRAAGFTLLALTPSPRARVIASIAPRLRPARVAIVLGHEGDGLTAGTLAICDEQARIPMATGVDSLNVAMAAGIGLYELGRFGERGRREVGGEK